MPPVFNSANFSPGMVAQNVTQGLIVIRTAMNVAEDLYLWSSGVALADLVAGAGLAQTDAQAIQTAIADAYALNRFYNTGLPPAGYPQPPSAYVYGASQRIVIGARTS